VNSFLRAHKIFLGTSILKKLGNEYDEKVVVPYSKKEIAALFAACEEGERIIWQFFLESGCREGAVWFSSVWSDCRRNSYVFCGRIGNPTSDRGRCAHGHQNLRFQYSRWHIAELGPSDCVKLFCDLSCEHWDCHFGKRSSDKGHAESAQQWALPRILGLLVQLLHAAVRLGLSVTSNRHESTRSFGHMDRVYRYRWSGQIRVP